MTHTNAETESGTELIDELITLRDRCFRSDQEDGMVDVIEIAQTGFANVDQEKYATSIDTQPVKVDSPDSYSETSIEGSLITPDGSAEMSVMAFQDSIGTNALSVDIMTGRIKLMYRVDYHLDGNDEQQTEFSAYVQGLDAWRITSPLDKFKIRLRDRAERECRKPEGYGCDFKALTDDLRTARNTFNAFFGDGVDR